MKPFDLEKAKAGHRVVTRDGRPVRIVCYDRKINNYPILALVPAKFDDVEIIVKYTLNGRYLLVGENEFDLMMAPVKHEGWTNLYRNGSDFVVLGESVYESEEEARLGAWEGSTTYIGPIEIEWEE